MKDQRLASDLAFTGGEFKPFTFAEEFLKLTIVGIKRKNGEDVDISNPNKIFSEILTLNEANQLLMNHEHIVGIEKKVPKIESL